MKLLLDTCAMLWLAGDTDRLSLTARNAVAANSGELFVSAISAFEISLKFRKGKIAIGMQPEVWWPRAVARHGLIVLPVTDQIALSSTALPPLHGDPSDRIIIATANSQLAAMVTRDSRISQYGATTVIW